MASFWGELRRRNVFRVGIAYLAAVWVLIEVADTLVSIINAPAWIPQVLVYSAALGFPLALVLAWFYEWTSQGIRVTGDVAAIEAVKFMGRKLDFAIIGLLVVAIGFLLVGRIEAPGPSIAALPFSNESAEEENAEFFANGMHDELLTQLAKISSLKSIARNSVEGYRDSPKSNREIGRELSVATLLLGRVQRAGDRVRINVELVDAESDRQLWGESYDRQLTAENIFGIQSEIATAIANALDATLTPEEASRLNDLPTTNTDAYYYYQSGNEYDRRNEESLAAEQYQLAVDEDPDFAWAWAALSQAYSGTGSRVTNAREFISEDEANSRLRLAREAFETAFRLQSNLPEAFLARGTYYYHAFFNYEGALREWAIAERGMRGDSRLYAARARVYRRMGQIERAADAMDQAVGLDPRNVDLLETRALIYESLRDYTPAEEILDRIVEIQPDNFFASFRRPLIRFHRGDVTSLDSARDLVAMGFSVFPTELWRAALYDGDYGAALKFLDEWEILVLESRSVYRPKDTYYAVTYQLAEMPDHAVPHLRAALAMIEQNMEADSEDPRFLIARGEVLAGLGDAQSAIDLARQAIKLLPALTDASFRPAIRLNSVMVFVAAGDHDSAIEELDVYLSAPGEWSIEGLLRDPRLEPIRNEPDFLALVEEHQGQP